MSNSNRHQLNEISPDGRNDGSRDNEPFVLDFDAMSEGCMSNMIYTVVLLIIFALAVICN